jgi:hypothetical protein
MIKKHLVSSAILAALVFVNFNIVFAADGKPSFLAGVWSNFRNRISNIIQNIYAPRPAPVPVAQRPSRGLIYSPIMVGFDLGLQRSSFLELLPRGGVSDLDQGGLRGDFLEPLPRGGANDLDDEAKKDDEPPPPPPPPPAPPKPILIKPPVIAPVAPLPVLPVSQAKVLELVVTAVSNMVAVPVKEGGQIQFLANLKLSNGTFKEVTKLVKWSVLGDIGSIDVSGNFSALLGMSVSEMGEGVGSVIAIYTGPEGTFLGKSAIFKVYAVAGPDTVDIGGQ